MVQRHTEVQIRPLLLREITRLMKPSGHSDSKTFDFDVTLLSVNLLSTKLSSLSFLFVFFFSSPSKPEIINGPMTDFLDCF